MSQGHFIKLFWTKQQTIQIHMEWEWKFLKGNFAGTIQADNVTEALLFFLAGLGC